MPSNPRITVAISTLGARAGQIALPPPHPAICYAILLQRPKEFADRANLAGRADVQIHPLDTIGLSLSRNAGLNAAQTDYLQIADDDVAFNTSGLLAVVDALDAQPGLAILTGKRGGGGGARRYASAPRALRIWNIARTASPEITLRLDAIRKRGLWFDPGFGLGARHPIGEEFIFLADALRAGLKGRFMPIVIGDHPKASTGDDWTNADLLRARIAVLGRVFGRAAPLWRLAFALKHQARLRQTPGCFWRFLTGTL